MSRIESRREAGGGCPGGEQRGETGGVRAGSGQPEETGGGAGGKQPEKAGGVSPGLVRADERVDDLQRNGYRIIQKRDGFCFGMDAVLLSGFARARRGERVLDLGTGTGIIPILLEAKTKGEHFTGLEIQEQVADMAQRSVKLNGQCP